MFLSTNHLEKCITEEDIDAKNVLFSDKVPKISTKPLQMAMTNDMAPVPSNETKAAVANTKEQRKSVHATEREVPIIKFILKQFEEETVI